MNGKTDERQVRTTRRLHALLAVLAALSLVAVWQIAISVPSPLINSAGAQDSFGSAGAFGPAAPAAAAPANPYAGMGAAPANLESVPTFILESDVKSFPPGTLVNVGLWVEGTDFSEMALLLRGIRLEQDLKITREKSQIQDAKRQMINLVGASLPVSPDRAEFLNKARSIGRLIVRTAEADPQAAKNLPSLASMLEQALKNNPDLQVAEAKLREAEAQLGRARLEVVQKVLTLRQSLETQHQVVAQAKKRVEAARAEQERIREAGVPPQNVRQAQQVVEAAETELIQAEAKLAEIHASVPYLLGRQVGRGSYGMGGSGYGMIGSMGDMMSMMDGMENQMISGMMMGHYGMEDAFGSGMAEMMGSEMRTPAAGETDPDSQMRPPQRDKNSKAKDAAVMKGAQPTHGTGQPQPDSRTDESAMMQGYSGAMSEYAMSMGMGAPPRRSPATSNRQKAAERLLAALESPTQADFLDIPLSDVLEFYSDLHGIAFVMGDDATIADKRINLTLREQIPLGSVLQALTDKSGIQFYVRDYGILVQDGDQPRPEGAVSVQQFRSNPRAVDDYLSGTARGFSSGSDYYYYDPMGGMYGGSTSKAPTGVRDKPKAPADEPDEKPSTATQPTDDTEAPPKASSKANPKDDPNDNPQPQK